MENFKKNMLFYIILLLFTINWLSYFIDFFHSFLGIDLGGSFIIDVVILLLIIILLFINSFKISKVKYVSIILVTIIILIKNYYLYEYLKNWRL